jgi:Protein of unknown function DUF45
VNRTKPDVPRQQLAQRIRDWAARLDVRVQAVTIRKMKRKWASCSTAGRLTPQSLRHRAEPCDSRATASVLSSATWVYCDRKSSRELLHRHTR